MTMPAYGFENLYNCVLEKIFKKCFRLELNTCRGPAHDQGVVVV